jgi:hypothetical protein
MKRLPDFAVFGVGFDKALSLTSPEIYVDEFCCFWRDSVFESALPYKFSIAISYDHQPLLLLVR